jgi:hypothetical protein
MANFAVIENDVVVNVIIADNKQIAETITGLTCIEYADVHDAGIGWAYNGTKFIKPTLPTPRLLTPEDADRVAQGLPIIY